MYASGHITNADAGGLIGKPDSNIKVSVYNGNTCGMVGGNGEVNSIEQNSSSVSDILGTVYCFDGQPGNKECWDNKTIWQAVKDYFPILQGLSAPSSKRPTFSSSPRRGGVGWSLSSPSSRSSGRSLPSVREWISPTRLSRRAQQVEYTEGES